MKKPSTIESNLVALSLVAGGLFGVLLLAMFGVQQALGASLDRVRASTLPAQQAVTEFEASVAALFARDIRVLGALDPQELAQQRGREHIDARLAKARSGLDAALPSIEGSLRAHQHSSALGARTHDLLEYDRALFESVERTHSLREALAQRSAELQTSMQQLVQNARAVAGQARLEYTLQLRTLARSPNPASVRGIVYGDERAQQDAAENVVAAVLHLGQLTGKIALSRTEDELNSVVANELAQNLARARTHTQRLNESLADSSPIAARARDLQAQFESVAQRIQRPEDPASLVGLRRAMLQELTKRSELQNHIKTALEAFSRELDMVQSAVSREAGRTMARAGNTLIFVRVVTLLVLAVALWIAWRSTRRVRASLADLRRQNVQLETLSADLQRMNEGLEQTVAERSAELLRRERALRLILDAMDEGLVNADRNGTLSDQCSRAAIGWFGEPPSGAKVWDYLFDGTNQREQFRLGFEQASEDILPFEVSISALPERFRRNGRSYSLCYRQVFQGEQFAGILTVVKDVTAQSEAEQREREAREQHTLLANLLRDKQGFQIFVRECSSMLGELRDLPPRESALRTLHTLKGSAAVYGMDSVARHCHQLEDQLAERAGSVNEHEIRELTNLWRARLDKIGEIVTAENTFELHETELGELVHGLRGRRDYDELLGLVDSWKWTKTASLLGRLGAQVRELAKRLHKTVEVRIEHNDLRVLPNQLEDFWSALVHVTRNAVDHGIETEAERIQLGKALPARIILRSAALASGQGFAVEIEDDGRGIDFVALRLAAERAQLTATSDAELLEAMFVDGVTSRQEASETSGRGVGLAAVAAACRSNGGSVEVETRAGAGSTFRFKFSSQQVRVRQLPANFPRVHLSVRPPALAS